MICSIAPLPHGLNVAPHRRTRARGSAYPRDCSAAIALRPFAVLPTIYQMLALSCRYLYMPISSVMMTERLLPQRLAAPPAPRASSKNDKLARHSLPRGQIMRAVSLITAMPSSRQSMRIKPAPYRIGVDGRLHWPWPVERPTRRRAGVVAIAVKCHSSKMLELNGLRRRRLAGRISRDAASRALHCPHQAHRLP